MADLANIYKIAPDLFEVQLHRRYEASVATVWDALTTTSRMAKWFATTTYQPIPGSPITMDFGDNDISTGTIQAFDARKLMQFTSIDANEGAETLVSFAVAQEHGLTSLILTHTRQSAWGITHTAPGWHATLELLAAELAGEPAEWDPIWQSVKGLYRDIIRDLL